MKEYKTMAHINSLKGEMAEITVLDKVGNNDYIRAYRFSNIYDFTRSFRKSNILLNSDCIISQCQLRFYGFAVRIKNSANGLRKTDKISFYPTTTFLLS